MNLATVITIILVGLGVWYAIHTLRKTGGHPCSSCRGGDDCPYCKAKKK